MAATWALLAVLVVQSAGRGNSAGFGYGMSPWEYLRTQFGWITHYLVLSIWPNPLVLDYGKATPLSPTEIALYALVVGGLMVATLAALRWQPWIGFLGCLVPRHSGLYIEQGHCAAVRPRRRPNTCMWPAGSLAVLVTVGGWLACQKLSQKWPGCSRGAAVLAAGAVLALACWTWDLETRTINRALSIQWETVVAARPEVPRGFISRGIADETRPA